MSPRTFLISAAVAVVLTAGGAGAAGAAGPVATAAKDCGHSRSLGTEYVTDITAKRVSCAKAKDVIRAFNRCRHRNGPRGRCRSKVAGGFRCSEDRGAASPFQYTARASCWKGGKRVTFTYTQNF